MATVEAARLAAARRIGVELEEYLDCIGAGELWCWSCRRFLPATSLGLDRSNRRGRQWRCRKCRRVSP